MLTFRTLSKPRAACQLMLLAALVAASLPADAKRRGGSSSRSSSSSHNDQQESSGGPSITIRTNSSSSSSSSSSASQIAPGASSGFIPITPPPAGGERDTRTPEQLAAIERAEAQKAAEQKAIAEKQEADRLASERLAAAQKAAADRAEMAERARVAAVQEAKRREQAAAISDTDRVLQRAKSDYPVLNTPAGEPVLQKILARQKALVERGAYPSVAMVEAVADHAYELTPRQVAQPQAVSTAAPAAKPNSFGNCRWASATQWVCN
jgi:hypothetical protein